MAFFKYDHNLRVIRKRQAAKLPLAARFLGSHRLLSVTLINYNPHLLKLRTGLVLIEELRYKGFIIVFIKFRANRFCLAYTTIK